MSRRDAGALRIAITADPYVPVPPTEYGGIERVVDFLVEGLLARGHRVTLFAHPDSRTAAELVPYGVPPHVGPLPRARELAEVAVPLYRRRRDLDVVHSFGRLAALLPILPVRRLAKLQTYQREAVPWRSVARAARLAGDSIRFTACSTSVWSRGGPPPAGRWTTVFNGVRTARYRPTESVPGDAPLVFLGRLEPMKGAHHAIAVARRAGRRLVIAGNRVENGSAAGYFEREIAPHLSDAVVYVGPVDDARKNDLLGGAAALLMLVEWEEPFGIVMAEALACGTPVLGFPRGAVPEVVVPGVNGFLVSTLEEAAAAVPRLGALDRRAIRRDAEARFGDAAIVTAYERLYRELAGGSG